MKQQKPVKRPKRPPGTVWSASDMLAYVRELEAYVKELERRLRTPVQLRLEDVHGQ